MIDFALKVALSATALCAVASCGEFKGTGTVAESAQPIAEFSAADKRAARSLSISNNNSVAMQGGPYGEALLCSYAISQLAERLEKSSSLTDEMIKGIAQAKGIYDRRVLELAPDKERPESAQDQLRKISGGQLDPAATARSAMACLLKLEKPS